MSDASTRGMSAYDELRRELREADIFASVSALLGWDQEAMMPPSGTPLRAEQSAALSQLIHQRRTAPRIGELLAACEIDTDLLSDELVAANIREMRRDFDRSVRLPTSLVRELADTTTRSQHAWREARDASDFQAFAPWLERVVDLTREKAKYLADDDSPDLYDALLDLYEPGARASEIGRVFGELRSALVPLIAELAAAPDPPVDRSREISVPVRRQAAFNRRVAQRIGFDFAAGRLDTSAHPFCQGVGPGDTRLTSRYRPDAFFDGLSSTMHEAGHGMYEQNLPKTERFGEPLSEAVSLGVHESQSRMWENFVGRSRGFWSWLLPRASQHLGGSFERFSVDDVFGTMNIVRPNLIRVESDEATYNLHIMLRFDLERALLAGDLAVADLPEAWNQRVREDLQLEVPDDRRGCLQDVHWSFGAIGYFPTYTLGNLYAAQFWATIQRQIPDLEERIAAGDFAVLLDWLKREIHRHGRRYTAPELCERVTGGSLSAEPFMAYLRGKLAPLYGIGA